MYVTSDQICTGLRYLSIGTCLRECVAAKCEIKVVCSKQWHKTAHRFVVLWERKKKWTRVFKKTLGTASEGFEVQLRRKIKSRCSAVVQRFVVLYPTPAG